MGRRGMQRNKESSVNETYIGLTGRWEMLVGSVRAAMDSQSGKAMEHVRSAPMMMYVTPSRTDVAPGSRSRDGLTGSNSASCCCFGFFGLFRVGTVAAIMDLRLVFWFEFCDGLSSLINLYLW